MRRYQIILIAVILAGAVLRLNDISKRDFWFDEAFTGIAIRADMPEMMRIVNDDVHPPLYYLTTKPVAALFGYDVFGIRFVSLIAGVLGIVAVFLLTQELVDTKAGLWAAAAASILPFAVQYSQEARMYALFGLLIILSAYFAVRARKRDERWAYPIAGIFAGAAMLTHYVAMVYVLVIALYVAFSAIRPRIRRKESLYNAAFFFASAVLVFSPWISAFIRHVRYAADHPLTWVQNAEPIHIIKTLQSFVLGSPTGNYAQGNPEANQMLTLSPVITSIAVSVVVLAIVAVLARKRRSESLWVIFWALAPIAMLFIASQFGAHYFVPRYMFPSAYFLAVTAGMVLGLLKPRISFAALMIFLILTGYITTPAPNDGWNTMVRNPQEIEGTTVYTLNPFDYVLAQYYLGSTRTAIYYSEHPETSLDTWAAINEGVRQVRHPAEILNDPQAVIAITSRDSEDIKRLEHEGYPQFANVAVTSYNGVFLLRFR